MIPTGVKRFDDDFPGGGSVIWAIQMLSLMMRLKIRHKSTDLKS
jgi:hypothetical protein